MDVMVGRLQQQGHWHVSALHKTCICNVPLSCSVIIYDLGLTLVFFFSPLKRIMA